MGRYPKGLLAAVRATSNGSIPSPWHASDISFAYAIATVLWQFSYNFDISATSGLLTGTTVSKTVSYNCAMASSEPGAMSSSPETTFGIDLGGGSIRPGSILWWVSASLRFFEAKCHPTSGDIPAKMPRDAASGPRSALVMPTATVLSMTTTDLLVA